MGRPFGTFRTNKTTIINWRSTEEDKILTRKFFEILLSFKDSTKKLAFVNAVCELKLLIQNFEGE